MYYYITRAIVPPGRLRVNSDFGIGLARGGGPLEFRATGAIVGLRAVLSNPSQGQFRGGERDWRAWRDEPASADSAKDVTPYPLLANAGTPRLMRKSRTNWIAVRT